MISNFQRLAWAAFTVTLVVSCMGINSAEAARSRKHVYHAPPDRFAEIVIEASTGTVLSERNADKRLYPASLTKMMTLYMTFEAMEKGTLSKNQRVPVSRRAAAQEPSSLGLSPGETIRVEDAILGIATKSANDAAVVLAEAIGGSEERFARLMTAKARELGMNNTRYVNASGLFKPSQVSTARDTSILSQALIHNYPKQYRYFSTDSFTYAGNTYINHNKLMAVYRGMDGLKTGYVYASGYNLAASAVRNGTRLIGVIFGGRTAMSRNNAMAQLLDQGFASIDTPRIAALIEQNKHGVIPARQPAGALDADTAVANNDVTDMPQQFNSMGMTVDQGDTDAEDKKTAPAAAAVKPAAGKKFISDFKPRPLNTLPMDATPRLAGNSKGGWTIQIGAFSSHDAGVKALQLAKSSLHGAVSGMDSIAPLMTNRGMIYRARLSGLGRKDAAQACQILKGNCLILTVE